MSLGAERGEIMEGSSVVSEEDLVYGWGNVEMMYDGTYDFQCYFPDWERERWWKIRGG